MQLLLLDIFTFVGLRNSRQSTGYLLRTTKAYNKVIKVHKRANTWTWVLICLRNRQKCIEKKHFCWTKLSMRQCIDLTWHRACNLQRVRQRCILLGTYLHLWQIKPIYVCLLVHPHFASYVFKFHLIGVWAYYHQLGTNPESVIGSKKCLLEKPNSTLSDLGFLGIKPRTSCSAVAFTTTRPTRHLNLCFFCTSDCAICFCVV